MDAVLKASGSALSETRGSAPQPCLLIPLRDKHGGVKAYTVVDAADYPELSQHRWYLSPGGYAMRHIRKPDGRRTIAGLHRVVMGLEPGDPRQVDHMNRRPLDNRRSNLRVVVEDQHNKQNVPGRCGDRYSSTHRGVSYFGADRNLAKHWRGRVYMHGRQVWLEYFATEQEAAEATARKRRELMPYAID